MAGLVLASGSEARARLLARAGVPFVACPSKLDEDALRTAMKKEGASPAQMAERLAEAKALSHSAADTLVIGADQILECDGQRFDKASSRDEALEALRFLRGRTHSLHTAVCVAQNGVVVWGALSTPRLHMRAFSDAFLEDYVRRAGDAVVTCVGAYEYEGLGAQLFQSVEGDYFSVLGLPLLPLLDFLRRASVLET